MPAADVRPEIAAGRIVEAAATDARHAAALSRKAGRAFNNEVSPDTVSDPEASEDKLGDEGAPEVGDPDPAASKDELVDQGAPEREV